MSLNCFYKLLFEEFKWLRISKSVDYQYLVCNRSSSEGSRQEKYQFSNKENITK